MEIKRQHWILGGGLGLAASLWLMDGLTHTLVNLGEMGLTGGSILLGIWWLRQRSTVNNGSGIEQQAPDRAVVDRSMTVTQVLLDQLAEESIESGEAQQALIQLQTQKNELMTVADRQTLHLVLVGGQSTGKTTLAQILTAHQPQLPYALQIQDIPGWFVPELNSSGAKTQSDSKTALSPLPLDADIVLFLTTGDLTESDLTHLQHLRTQCPLLVVLNKQDQYLPGQQAVILEQLRHRLSGMIATDDIVAIAAAPTPIKVRRQQPDGSWQTWQEQPEPSIAPLLQRLALLLESSELRQQMIWSTTYRTARHLQQSTHTVLNQLRHDRALTDIEQYQWIAGGAAFVNPIVSLDLLATVAINGQLIFALGKLYRQSFSLTQAQEIAATIAEMVVKLGLVELTTQALSAVLKTSSLTFWVGAGLQGISAAYLTRMVGLSLVEYFEELDPLASEQSIGIDRLRQILQRVFANNQRVDLLKHFTQQAWEKLKAQSPQIVGT